VLYSFVTFHLELFSFGDNTDIQRERGRKQKTETTKQQLKLIKMGGANSTLYCDPSELNRSLEGEVHLITGFQNLFLLLSLSPPLVCVCSKKAKRTSHLCLGYKSPHSTVCFSPLCSLCIYITLYIYTYITSLDYTVRVLI
jgi:hypothetical protein